MYSKDKTLYESLESYHASLSTIQYLHSGLPSEGFIKALENELNLIEIRMSHCENKHEIAKAEKLIAETKQRLERLKNGS